MRTGPSPFKRSYLDDGTFAPITPRQYLIAFEGARTEPQYFDGLRRNADRIGINGSSIQCKPLLRSYLEEGCSHPRACLERLDAYLSEARKESMSVDTLATHATDWAVETCIVPRKGNEMFLRSLKDRVVEQLVKHGYRQEQLIPNADLDDVIGLCYRIITSVLSRHFRKQDYLRFVDTLKNERAFFSDDDIACLVVDRDSGSFSDTDYDEIRAECDRKKIRFIVTNPQFEFWLLLHFTDGTDLDAKMIAENPDLILDALKRYVSGNPKRVDFSQYVDRIQDAIEHEMNFAEDIEGLKNHVGSNIGTLISEMIRGKVQQR